MITGMRYIPKLMKVEMKGRSMIYCTKCYMPETRPRITFNKEGVCNACQWTEEKKNVDWDARQKYFGEICDRYRGNGREVDCIVPWSGGKDSIYVAYKVKEFGMNPLLVTVLPHLETTIGAWNRIHCCSEFQRMEISLKKEKYRTLAKKYFIEQGRPKHPWECAISAAIINQSVSLKLPFIIYGEEGEAEYGGVTTEKDKWKDPVSKDYLMKYYWQNNLDWTIPNQEDFATRFFTQWSRFEDWRPSEHGNSAIVRGMRSVGVRHTGTFTTMSQISDKFQDLHVLLMFLKFGFGRCTSDVSIAIREGWLGRREGKTLIDAYDGEIPYHLFNDYYEYFNMDEVEFWRTLTNFANLNCIEWNEEKRQWALIEAVPA